MLTLSVNGQNHDVDLQHPLLWVLRDGLGLADTKSGCGAGQCWGCTVPRCVRPWSATCVAAAPCSRTEPAERCCAADELREKGANRVCPRPCLR